MNSSASFVAWALVGSSTLSVVGCANIEMVSMPQTSRVASTGQRPVHRMDAPVARVSSDGTSLELEAHATCDVVKYDDVELTDHLEARNKSPVFDWTLGVGGALVAGAGVGILADSKNVYGSSTSSQNYNKYGHSSAAVGWGAIGVGTLAGVISVVDIVRAQRTASTVTHKEVERGKIGSCQGAIMPNESVAALLQGEGGNHVQVLGHTDTAGKLSVALSTIQQPPLTTCSLDKQPFTDAMQLMIRGQVVANVPLAPLYERWIESARVADEELERAAAAEIATCHSRKACPRIEAYSKRRVCFSDPERRQKILDALDDASWSDADPVRCAKSLAENACEGVARYTQQYREGRHSDEAKGVQAANLFNRVQIFRHLDDWFRRSIVPAHSQQDVFNSTCKNRVGVEVPCESAAAFTKSDTSALVSFVTIHNRAKFPIHCTVGESEVFLMGLAGARLTSSAETIGAGKRHTFKIVESGMSVFTQKITGMAENNRVATCFYPSAQLNREVPGIAEALGTDPIRSLVMADANGQPVYAVMSESKRFFFWMNGDLQEIVQEKK